MPKELDHDQLFKKLIKTFFVEFLELFAPELASYIDPSSLEFLPQEYFTDLQSGEQTESGSGSADVEDEN